ncbi:MAG: DUF4065 domain-containing protein [Lachnospiraceae bacterium]|nr:DUF4065 domain-containing protein [Lachnospiraceae bacterium]
MTERRDKILCSNCRHRVDYSIKTRCVERIVKGNTYQFNERYAVCDNCNEEMFVPGLDDENERIFENIYRKRNALITMDEIEEILKKYNIEKRPLSNLLGFGELTITRYLDGQLPSKKYSDLLLSILYNHHAMRDVLDKGKENIKQVAYNKVDEAIKNIERLTTCDTKIEVIALYVINSMYEITNMSLQKILYYIKAFSMVIDNNEMFMDNCEAWAYGPVFPSIYEKYKVFDRQIIEDCDAQINYDELLNAKEKERIDFVLNCFGIYNGKVLKEFTHKEEPWIKARIGFEENESCNNPIKEKDIQEYFMRINQKYGITEKSGVEKYIKSLNLI